MRNVAAHPRSPGLLLDLSAADLLAFLLPITMVVTVGAGAQVYATELLILLLAPFAVLMKARTLTRGTIATVLLLGIAWFAGQAATDFVRETPINDLTRGWSKIAFTTVNLIVIYILLARNPRRIAVFAVGLMIGQLLTYWFNPTPYVAQFPWKFGVGFAVTLGVTPLCAWLLNRGRRALAVAPLLMLVAVDLWMNCRSLSIITLLAAAITYFARSERDGQPRTNYLTYKNAVTAVALLAVVVLGFMKFYEYAVTQRWLGEEAFAKFQIQSGAAGMLLGGRSEILVSSRAVMDSPILGHGSWAKDPYYAGMLADERAKLGYRYRGSTGSGLIPTHSFFFGAWVEAGIVGAIFWGFVFWITAKALVLLMNVGSPLVPLQALVGVSMLWEIPFSPYGADRRFIVPFFIASLLAVLPMPMVAYRFRAPQPMPRQLPREVAR